ncbi:MAG: cytochrome P450, partial [Deltaproteobacteria bacterium]|nr:cytochrome P450 [Deltaproteobacteria bacterium]
FLAGHETTALALSYALHLLAEHPHAARRLAEEVDRVVGARPATVDDVPNLPFTDAVLRESMRLYPPAYLVGREVVEPVEIAGFPIAAGAQVLTPQWVVHRDPRWFRAPEVFLPERWLDGLASRLHRFAYFPFGGGPRVCVGNHFAMLEGVLVLATLAQSLRVGSVGHSLALMNSVTLRPTTGVWLDVQRR